MSRLLRIIIWSSGIVLVLCFAILLACNQIVANNAKGIAFSDIDCIKPGRVGLLLGTTPQTRVGNNTNMFFVYRIDAAEQLYKSGKIEQILISGDESSLHGVNEPECMRDALIARGIPDSVMILDGKGFRTISSIKRARDVYGLTGFTIISQQFHNERAIYQALHLGINKENIQAYNAQRPRSKRAWITYVREYFARVKMFMDLIHYS